jgi:peptide/nickel transport system substrate-binding protein
MMLKKTKARHLTIVFCLVALPMLILSSCGAQGTKAPNTTAGHPVKGGTWIDDVPAAPGSLLPQGSDTTYSVLIDQAIYAPLFYGDALGHVHAGIVASIPTVQNGGASSDLKTWTFKLLPNLKWSDGMPLNADDLVFSFNTYKDPKFGAKFTTGFDDIVSMDESADKLSVTMHLDKPIGNFVSNFVDANPGAPLPKHVFAGMAVDSILKSPDSQLPHVTNGPFMIKADESTSQLE